MSHLPVRRLLILALAIPGAACVPASSAAQAAPLDRARVLHVVDSIVGAEIAAGRAAGMSVAMFRGRDTLLLKAYGRANLELDVPTRPTRFTTSALRPRRSRPPRSCGSRSRASSRWTIPWPGTCRACCRRKSAKG